MAKQVKNYVKRKGRSLLFRLVFSRTMITLLLVLFQIFAIFAIFAWLEPYSTQIYAATVVLSALLIIYVTNTNVKTEFKLVWMLPLCAIPLFGVVLYLIILINPGSIGLRKAMKNIWVGSEKYMVTAPQVQNALQKENELRDIAYYIQNHGRFPAYGNTEVAYYPLGENKWEAMLEELKKAKEFIFLEYFIVSEGVMLTSILEILEQKVKEGVEVRFMYDGTYTVLNLSPTYAKKLRKLGIKVRVYAPIRPLLSTHQNFRDHRKILVIDGKVAFTGGINLADEYINRKELFGHWKDVAIKIEGDAVRSFTVMFLHLWHLGSVKKAEYEKYLKNLSAELPKQECGFIIPYGDDPTNGEDLAENIYIDIINKAERYVHIMSPYLVIDNGMLSTLTFAAKKGIDVSIILPHIPDKKVPWYIAKTYYPVLLQAGVKIYEYTPGFVHAKMFVSDDIRGVVGTVNLDYRSLYHHFECGAFIYQNPVNIAMEADFQETLKVCQQITVNDYKKMPWFTRFAGRALRLYGPLL